MHIFYGVFLLIWAMFLFVPVMMSPMAFDAPGSENDILLKVTVISLFIHFVSSIVSSGFFFFSLPCRVIPLTIWALSAIVSVVSFKIGIIAESKK